eukprot:CAMPEP_0118960054 /NCGR_PEP_ID=MMETSP1169-20130426/63444_1 /TAXON_ID=36882 /ORGANISM="Pyramimonas obovata, Strain CCMP722" /LENGTH=110 /DNA_ID=CAMNT_0006908197 /DNA_START=451 /DNA_END=780 /DNA_ORIENTATION=+
MTALALTLSISNRTMLSVAGLSMAEQFSWSAKEFGALQSAYLMGYPLTQMVGGALGDKIGAKVLFTVIVLLWSVATFAMPPAAMHGGLAAACVCRFLFGMATGPSLPIAH